MPRAKKLRHIEVVDAQPVAELATAVSEEAVASFVEASHDDGLASRQGPRLTLEEVAAQAAGLPKHAIEQGTQEGADVESVEPVNEGDVIVDEMQGVHDADVCSLEWGRFSEAVLEAASWYSLEDPAFWAAPMPQQSQAPTAIPLVGNSAEDFSLDAYHG